MASTDIRQEQTEPEEYTYNNFCQWLDIPNRSIYITISKEREFISEMIEYSNTKQGKLTVYIFSVGITNDEFRTTFPGMVENFETKNITTHNYKVSIDIDAHDIIPKFEKIRDEMKEDKRSLIIQFEKEETKISNSV